MKGFPGFKAFFIQDPHFNLALRDTLLKRLDDLWLR